MTHVVSMRDRPDLHRQWEQRGDGAGIVRIDRRTRWGNPFRITEGLSRTQAIAFYREHLWRRIRAGEVALEDLAALESQTLLCWCRRGSPATATYWRERLSGPPSSLGG